MYKKYLNKFYKNQIELSILEFLKEKNKEYEDISLIGIHHSERIKAYYISYAFKMYNEAHTTNILISYSDSYSIPLMIYLQYNSFTDYCYTTFREIFDKKRMQIKWGGYIDTHVIFITKNFEICYNLINSFSNIPQQLYHSQEHN